MHELLENICQQLDTHVQAISISRPDNIPYNELINWQCPTFTKEDLASIPAMLSKEIRNSQISELSNDEMESFKTIPEILLRSQNNHIPYLTNTSAQHAIPAYLNTMSFVRMKLNPLFKWSEINDNKLYPQFLSQRLKNLNRQIDDLTPDQEALKDKLTVITDAYVAADNLPTNLQILKDATSTVNENTIKSAQMMGTIEKLQNEALDISNYLQTQQEECKKVVDKIDEAYRITTTKGLAGAFEDRANKLKQSITIWVLGLLVALGAGSWLGYDHYKELTNLLNSQSPSWGIILLHITLSLIGVAAPIWFAWISTKQISQRFRLAEDYSYKASIAKAYEGYRKEAARLDINFEHRLFDSALTRLEEAPLRLMENDTHGSPWHELFTSKEFKSNLEKFPNLYAQFFEIYNKTVSKVAEVINDKKD